MRGVRGILAGALALVTLQTIVATRQGPDRTAGLVGLLSGAVANFLDPRVPAFGIGAGRKPTTPTPAPTPAAPASVTYPNPTTVPVGPG